MADTSGDTVELATVDLGSNSFHLLVAIFRDGLLEVVDQEKEMVRLAAGIRPDRTLSAEAQDRAIACLRRFGERLRGLPSDRVRAVGTNTFRAAKKRGPFLARASEALGHPIEIIDGAEEARLVYLGVAHGIQPIDGPQLVVDIGGGSTEVIVGRGFEAEVMHSLHMGCVTYTEGFFPGGAITEDRLRGATFAATNEVARVESSFHDTGFQRALGSSGTLKAIAAVLVAQGWTEAGITPRGLEKLRAHLLDAGHIDAIDLDGLSERRREVLPGGAAIAAAVIDRLGVERMLPVQTALREGAAYDLMGRVEGRDLREQTVEALQQRHGVDIEQAERVARRLDQLLVDAARWDLTDRRTRRFARWAAALHEVGRAVSFSGFHKHGAYLIENSELPGFSRVDQRLLAGLILCHRRRFRHEALRNLPGIPAAAAVRLGALLRLAVRLERSRGGSSPTAHLTVDGDSIALTLEAGVPEDHPLLVADLDDERERLARAGLSLSVTS